jgi:pyruvate formate lyase activating enzyme
MTDFITDDTVKTHYWHKLNDGHIQCDLCPRFCKLHADQRGLCFVRQDLNGQVMVAPVALQQIPSEKPLNHFYLALQYFLSAQQVVM